MSPPPPVGTPAPDLDVLDAAGEPLRLADLRGHPVVLVFLRHLGCPLCRLEIAELRRRHDEFAALGATVVVVVDSPAERVAPFVRGEDVPFRLIGDPEHSLYRRYGVARGGLRQIAAPGAARQTVRATLRGHLHGRFEGDERQLPAAFVIDEDGMVRLAHLGTHVGNTAPVEVLLEQCRGG